MASVDKVKVADTTYDVSPSKDGTLNGYTSGDSTSPSSWGNVDAITTSDTNSGIFNKITTMVRNIRWLYNKLGTVDISATGSDTITGGLVSVQNGLDGKADNGHSHGVGDLPISNSSVNSTSYVPSSAMVYGLKSIVESLSSDVANIQDQINPNNNYESKSLGTWSSTSDVDTFLSTYTHDNQYSGLKLGNYVTIQDGTYNTQWEIAGFDMEHNQTAADGNIYDNGYGICLIPKTEVTTGKWNTKDTTVGGYKSSTMHKTVLPGIVTKLKNVLGNHIVNRNVLLSSTVSSDRSSAYTWTTAYATLMSIGQMTGTFASHHTKYDDGEATYKLPLFNYEGYKTGSNFWSRGVKGEINAWYVSHNGNIYYNRAYSNVFGVRPLIYLR